MLHECPGRTVAPRCATWSSRPCGRWSGANCPTSKILELDEKDLFPDDLIRKLLSPDVGLHLIFLPEEAGGLGGGARDICRVSEEMAAIDLGVATAFLAICLGTDPILVGGTPEQKAKWLGRIAGEGLIVAYGVTEPEAGSNVAALKTTADRITDADGNVTGYRLNGAKQFITNGGVAQLYTILAKTPDGPSFFVVEREHPGPRASASRRTSTASAPPTPPASCWRTWRCPLENLDRRRRGRRASSRPTPSSATPA